MLYYMLTTEARGDSSVNKDGFQCTNETVTSA
jgi:hypothetical protein